MSADLGESDPWLSNGTYPALGISGLETAESQYPPQRPDLPTPEERIAGLLEEYPDRMATPISTVHGRKLRESVLDDPVTEEREIETGEGETVTVEDTVSRSALPLYSAVFDLLETYEGYRDKKLRMVKGFGEEKEQFLIDLSISYSSEYQRTTYAKLTALKRRLAGGEYSDHSACAGDSRKGAFDEPVTVLFGLTASAYNVPGKRKSGFRPPADHDREIREAWSGSSNSVKRVLRDVLERKLGLSSDQYAWWWQSEPHPGDGPAAGYSHAHPVVIFDAAASSVPLSSISEETFRPIVAKHVELCNAATWDAHQIEDSVTVKKPDEIKNFGSYVSKYLALGPDQDLLERSDEYIMWAASQWATTTQKYSKSRTATAAINADRCHQEFVDQEAEQPIDHADRIVPSSKPGISYECACCGSHFGIEQETETLSRARLDAIDRRSTTDHSDETDKPPQSLAERWPSATSAARVGAPVRERQCRHPANSDQCPLCASETESPNHTVSGEVPIPDDATAVEAPEIRESFEREPQWQPDAIVQTWDDEEETAIGSPGGTVYGEIVVEGHGSISDKCDLPYLPEVSVLQGPKPWENTPLFDESDVRAGRVPPPELVAREWCETVQSGRRVTAKQWANDWYTRRFENVSSPGGLSDSEKTRIREFVRTTGVTSVPSICGQLSIDPSRSEEIEACL